MLKHCICIRTRRQQNQQKVYVYGISTASLSYAFEVAALERYFKTFDAQRAVPCEMLRYDNAVKGMM